MRTLLTIIVGALFAVGFTLTIVFAALLSHLADPDSVLRAAKDGDAHALVVDVLEASLSQELETAEPEFRDQIGPVLRPAIVSVMGEQWFYDTFAVAYTGFAEVVFASDQDAEVDLGPRREELRAALYELGENALERCRAVSEGGTCASRGAELISDYRGRVDNVLKAMPSKTSLSMIIDEMGSRFLPPRLARSKALKDGARTLRILRWGALAALLVLAAMIIAINARPLVRALVALGLVLALSSAINLVVISVVGSQAASRLEAEFSTISRDQDDQVVVAAVVGSERVMRNQLSHALGGSSLLLLGWLAGGAALVGAGIALSRRRARP